jgi:hypothetical protein
MNNTTLIFRLIINSPTVKRGVDYNFTTVNGWVDNNNWYSTSEKDISYDENGKNPKFSLIRILTKA